MSDPNIIRRRKTIIVMGVAFLIVGAVSHPEILFRMASIKGLVSMGLLLFLSLFLAMAYRDFALAFLRGPGDPWYAKRGALLFLSIVVIFMGTMLIAFNHFMPNFFGIGQFLSEGFVYFSTGFALLWLSYLERPY